MTLKGTAAVTGVAELKPTRWTDDETTIGLFTQVGLQAIADAGLNLADIDGLIAHPMAGLPMLVPSTLIESMGLRCSFAETVDLGGATGAAMVWRAAAAIASGQANAVLCVTASRRKRRSAPAPGTRKAGSGTAGVGGKDTSAWAEFEVPFGNVGANIGYAMIAQRYLHEQQATAEQLAKIAVHQRDNACVNPHAWFYGQPITVSDVLDSPMVADPLHFLEIVMPSAGGAALVVVGPELARKWEAERGGPAAWLLGAGECCTHKTVTYAPSLMDTAIKPAADRAFAQAGVTRSQIGLASLYDCYTITVLVTLEEAGFCGRGEGGRFVEEHDLRWNGDFPLNTHGGQLSFSQPGLAGGMSHVTEAVRQVQQRSGDRQVAGLDFAFVNGNGGIMSEECALVLGVAP
ncbi:MAG: thiolase family protein [Acidimicrobiales bacterium]